MNFNVEEFVNILNKILEKYPKEANDFFSLELMRKSNPSVTDHPYTFLTIQCLDRVKGYLPVPLKLLNQLFGGRITIVYNLENNIERFIEK